MLGLQPSDPGSTTGKQKKIIFSFPFLKNGLMSVSEIWYLTGNDAHQLVQYKSLYKY